MKTIKKLEIRARRVPLSDIVAEERMVYSKRIHTPEDAVDIFRSILDGEDQEVFLAVYLDNKNKVIGYSEVARGTIDTCAVDLRVLFRPAILQGAASMLVGHNHPSGDPSASRDDVTLTERITEAAKMLGVAVLDHIIVAENNHISLAERGVI